TPYSVGLKRRAARPQFVGPPARVNGVRLSIVQTRNARSENGKLHKISTVQGQGGNGQRSENGKLHKISTVQGQGGNGLGSNDLADRRVLGLKQRRDRIDFNDLLDS